MLDVKGNSYGLAFVFCWLGNRHFHPDPVVLTAEGNALKIFVQAKQVQVFSFIFSRKS